jgi:glutamyl-tRNA reductase
MKDESWRLVACGVTHKTSSLEEREALQLGADEIGKANAIFCAAPDVMESVILATCNRVEFYFVANSKRDPADIIAEFYDEFKGIDIGSYRDAFRTRKARHAADHLFRVAAGIDSMVVGENQILGQVKAAYSTACSVKSAGKITHRLFHQAFRVGKHVRTDTEIGKGACSVSTAAVDMLDASLANRPAPVVLFIGINQMIDHAAKRLGRLEGARLLFANRSADKAAEYAAGFGAEGQGLERLVDLLADADVVVSCTSSREPVITRSMMSDALARRRGGTLMIVDMAVPRDVDLPRDFDPSVEVKDLDDIKRFVARQRQQRETAIPQAEEIISRRLDEFDYWYGHVLHDPIYNGRGVTMDAIRQDELSAILEKLPPELQNELNQATRRIVDRVVKITNRSANKRTE